MSKFCILILSFISWGIRLINLVKKKYHNEEYYNRLKVIAEDVNSQLAGVLNDNSILSGFESYMGRYVPGDIKREIFTLLSHTEEIYLYRVDYYTSVHPINKDLDFSKSKAFVTGFNILEDPKVFFLINFRANLRRKLSTSLKISPQHIMKNMYCLILLKKPTMKKIS